MPFPPELTYYGLTVEHLTDAFERGEQAKWKLRGIPNIQFYRQLHRFLKKWTRTRSLTKTCIGKFYLSIDIQLQGRGSSPYNTYRFIDGLVSTDIPDTALMSYGSNKQLSSLKAEVRGYHQHFQELGDVVRKQQAEMEKLRNEFKETKEDLLLTRQSLQQLIEIST